MKIRQKNLTHHAPPFKVIQCKVIVIGTDTDWSATYDFLLVIHINHGYSFWDKRLFRSEIAFFSHPRVFNAPLIKFPSEFC